MALSRRQIMAGGAAASAAFSFGNFSKALAQATGNAFIVSGFPPGGMGDMLSRPLSERMRGRYAASAGVDSRVGAGGRIAAEYVKRAKPDGMTILQIPSSVMTLYPHTYKSLTYDPVKDFIPVTSLTSYVFSFTAGPGLPENIKTVDEFLKWAKANPKQSLYGVPAIGSALHFGGMMLQRAAGIDFNVVGYRGGAPLLQDLLAGQVPVSFNVLGEVLPHVRSGKLRTLATTGAQRSPFIPEAPTMVESGFKDIALQEWLGWFLPAGTPMDVVQRLNAIAREGLQDPAMIESLKGYALVPHGTTPEEFARTFKADYDRWQPLVKETGFVAEDS